MNIIDELFEESQIIDKELTSSDKDARGVSNATWVSAKFNIDSRIWIAVDNDFSKLSSHFIDYNNNKDWEKIAFLIEFIRGHGLFYSDYQTAQSELLETLLNISIKLADNEELVSSDKTAMFIISELYDIVFHQAHLIDHTQECARLYFILTSKVLGLQYNEFLNFEKNCWYYQCLYFIEMADDWFKKRHSEFTVLTEKIKILKSNIGTENSILQNWLDNS